MKSSLLRVGTILLLASNIIITKVLLDAEWPLIYVLTRLAWTISYIWDMFTIKRLKYTKKNVSFYLTLWLKVWILYPEIKWGLNLKKDAKINSKGNGKWN